MRYETSILPCGTLNTKTGNTVYGTVTNLWSAGSGSLELWKKTDGKIVAIFTGGASGNKAGNTDSFKHDQRGAFLFNAEFVAAVAVEAFAEIAQHAKGSIRLYCYK